MKFKSIWGVPALVSGFLGVPLLGVVTPAPPTLELKQSSDGGNPQSLTPSERAVLGDPLFTLVLRDHANVTNLAEIERLIQPDVALRQVFVVDENIADGHRRPQARRSVLTFSGSNNGAPLASNVMLSVNFSDTEFSDTPTSIEAWGWDSALGRYNYYKLDRSGNIAANGPLTWKFRGSSDGADALTPRQRQGSCFSCHINGGPVMKELLLPWSNWHSFSAEATYLKTSSAPSERWPVAASPRLGNHLSGAETLEGPIIASLTRFGRARIIARLPLGVDTATSLPRTNAMGVAEVTQAKRLLRSLFVNTEVNLISARQKSGLHRTPVATASGPDQAFALPATALINAPLIAGHGILQYKGLGLSEANAFDSLVMVSPTEYKQLIVDTKTQLNGEPGDAQFAWLTPEPSHADNTLVEQMLRLKVLSPRFLAAVLSVDLETPCFSSERASLLAFMPDSFHFKPGATTPDEDELTRVVIAQLEAAHPAPGSASARFLSRLKDPDPVARLREDVAAYETRLQQGLSDPQARPAELQRLYARALTTRRSMINDPILGHLDETSGNLLPIQRPIVQ